MNDTAGVGVDLKQIYSSKRRSHHPNSAPQSAKPNPNYRAEKRGPSSLLLPEQQAEGEGTSSLTGGDGAESEIAFLLSMTAVEEENDTSPGYVGMPKCCHVPTRTRP